MRILIGALLCWTGFHDARWEIRLAGTLPRCRRCGQHLLVVR